MYSCEPSKTVGWSATQFLVKIRRVRRETRSTAFHVKGGSFDDGRPADGVDFPNNLVDQDEQFSLGYRIQLRTLDCTIRRRSFTFGWRMHRLWRLTQFIRWSLYEFCMKFMGKVCIARLPLCCNSKFAKNDKSWSPQWSSTEFSALTVLQFCALVIFKESQIAFKFRVKSKAFFSKLSYLSQTLPSVN